MPRNERSEHERHARHERPAADVRVDVEIEPLRGARVLLLELAQHTCAVARATQGAGEHQRAGRQAHEAAATTAATSADTADACADLVGTLSEHKSKAVLAEIGIQAPPEVLCSSADEAVAAATSVGYPVVMKASSPDLAHKSELGLVRLNLRDEADLRQSFGELLEAGQRAAPSSLEGILVQPFVRGGVETIVGLNDDPHLGRLIMLGLGGTLVEALGAVTWRACPLSAAEAEAMIDDLPALTTLLRGVRGAPPADRPALVRALVALSGLAESLGDRLETVDVNPLLVLPEGQGALAVDALVVMDAD